MQPSRSSPLLPPRAALFIAILAVSTASIFVRFAQREASSLAISAYRLVIAALVLLPVSIGALRREVRWIGSRDLLWGFLSGVLLALHFATWISSLQYTTVASSVVLVSTAPLWVALFSPWILKERLDRRVLIGLVVALAGGTVVGIGDACQLRSGGLACLPLGQFFEGKAMWGNLLALVGAWCAAGYFMIGRSLRARLSLQTYIVGVYSTAGLLLLGIAGLLRLPLTGFSHLTYFWLVCLGLIPQLIGHSAYNWSLKYLPATDVSVALFGEPVGSTILAYLILGENPGWLKAAGGILILVGIYLAASRSDVPGDQAALTDLSQ